MAWLSTEILIYIIGVMILQMKLKTKFGKIGPCTFKGKMIPIMKECWSVFQQDKILGWNLHAQDKWEQQQSTDRGEATRI